MDTFGQLKTWLQEHRVALVVRWTATGKHWVAHVVGISSYDHLLSRGAGDTIEAAIQGAIDRYREAR